MSAIASDSSYAMKMQPKDVTDSEDSQGNTVKIKPQRTRARGFGTSKPRDNLN